MSLVSQLVPTFLVEDQEPVLVGTSRGASRLGSAAVMLILVPARLSPR